jgi:hypothetical protein
VAIRDPNQRTAAQTLTRTQKISVLAYRAIRVADDVRNLGMISQCIRWEFRPSTIVKLTGAPGFVVRSLYDREVSKPMTGRLKTKIGDFMARPLQHLQVTEFIIRYTLAFELDGREIIAPGFLRAYEMYRDLATPELALSGEGAVALAEAMKEGLIHFAHCTACGTPYMRSKVPIPVAHAISMGDCPYCRSLRSSNSSRIRLDKQDIAEARKEFKRILRDGGPKPRKTPRKRPTPAVAG